MGRIGASSKRSETTSASALPRWEGSESANRLSPLSAPASSPTTTGASSTKRQVSRIPPGPCDCRLLPPPSRWTWVGASRCATYESSCTSVRAYSALSPIDMLALLSSTRWSFTARSAS